MHFMYGLFTYIGVTMIPVASYNIFCLIMLRVVRDSDSSKDVRGRNHDAYWYFELFVYSD
jgi:hypothetical protein